MHYISRIIIKGIIIVGEILVKPTAAALKWIVGYGMEYCENKRQERFKSFFEELYKDTATQERIEYEQQIKAFPDDFYGLLNAAIEDEEKEKVNIVKSSKIPQYN